MHEGEGYICLNGRFLKNNEPWLFSTNRAFRYGEALTENIHAGTTEPQLLNLHIERLTNDMRTLSMDVPAYLNEKNLRELIISLLNKNRLFGGAVIRMTVFREYGVNMVPDNNTVSFIIESSPLEAARYELNDKGLSVGISGEITRTTGTLAHIHSANRMLFLMAGLECKKENLDAIIMLNQAGRLTETSDSNIFLVSGRSLFTPGIDQGCIPGVMRKVVIKMAIDEGYRVNDQSSLTPAALLDADEVFLTNTVYGIRWIGAYRRKRYFSKTSRMLTGKLNQMVF